MGEDGTRTMYVGDEAFNLSAIDDNVFLFEENSQEIHVCHGFIKKRIVATPRNLNSVTHMALKRAQYTKFEPNQRTTLITPEEEVQARQMLEIMEAQKKRQAQTQKRIGDPSGLDGEMTAAFLEDEAPVGPSI